MFRREFTGAGAPEVKPSICPDELLTDEPSDLAPVTFTLLPKDMDLDVLAASIVERTWEPTDIIQLSIRDSGKTKGRKDNPDSIEMSGLTELAPMEKRIWSSRLYTAERWSWMAGTSPSTFRNSKNNLPDEFGRSMEAPPFMLAVGPHACNAESVAKRV